MKKSTRNSFIFAGIFFFLFLLLTFLVVKVDVQPIGPSDSEVGLATLNGAVFESCGDNPVWYTVSEALGILSLLTAAGFGGLGVWQWISRKSLKKVDLDLFALAGLYAAVAVFYVLFEIIEVNYRPILMNGVLEASYPSSHTMLVCCIMLSAGVQLRKRIKNDVIRIVLQSACCVIFLLTAVGRIFAGVHWYTDVLAALLLSGALVFAYIGAVQVLEWKAREAQLRKLSDEPVEEKAE